MVVMNEGEDEMVDDGMECSNIGLCVKCLVCVSLLVQYNSFFILLTVFLSYFSVHMMVVLF